MTGYSGIPVTADGSSASLYISYRGSLYVENCRYIPMSVSMGAVTIHQSDSNIDSGSQTRGININMWMGDDKSTLNITNGLTYNPTGSGET